jgi:glycosyltransferase involved in cell wall biosynthesis
MEVKKKIICIATPLYPPDVGGPSYYAKGLQEALEALGYETRLITYGRLMRLPTGIRHFLYFMRLLPQLLGADKMVVLDTFSAALPAAVASYIIRVPFVVRTGGDFVWEQYLDRTKDLMPLKDFYTKERAFTTKEKILLKATKFVLVRASLVIFSTELQRNIWTVAYAIDPEKTRTVENAIETALVSEEPAQKNFLWYVRATAFKNSERVHAAFAKAKESYPDIILEEGQLPKAQLLVRMKSCYAVILPSITEISPNYILDALRFHKPFIMDKYSGLADQLAPYGTLVDPLSVESIADGIMELASDEGYARAKEKAKTFSRVRTYADIANEIAELLSEI